MLNDRVLPWYESQGIPILRILTDRGSEYKGNIEHHAFELFLSIEGIECTTTKAYSPQTNVRLPGNPLGTRCEIKNINSIRNIMRAIEFEANRQVNLIENGQTIIQETRLFDADIGETRTMRLKEESHDCRYFPDPDLLPIVLSEELIEQLARELPELPDAKIKRYIAEYSLNTYDAEVLAGDEQIAYYFEAAVTLCNPKILSNWISSELFGQLNEIAISLNECKITPKMLARMVKLIEDGVISGKIAKVVFETIFETGEQPEKIIKEKGLVQMSDSAILSAIIDEILWENPDSVAAYKSGKDKLFGFFVGQVMKKLKARPILT
ncbi:hypothetical protein J6590_078287 [Homalodisca vitripennis]|nr:hypothetical protein J6590_078287 [Homalodisca vitripennis]